MTIALSDLPLPPIARLLGWRLIRVDAETGEVEIAFDGKPEFANPNGVIQGGILVAMMDDTMGPAAYAFSNGERMTSSVDIHAHFLRAVKIGPITVKARVTKLGGKIGFLEAQLFDAAGQLCARATSSAYLSDPPAAFKDAAG